MNEQKFESYLQVLVRDNNSEKWRCTFYSHYDDDLACGVCVNGCTWKQCIPYKGNEHLVGTSESPEEKEKLEFGDKVLVSDFRDTPYKKAIFVEYNDRNSKYVVLTKNSRTIDEWRYCRKGWDENDSK